MAYDMIIGRDKGDREEFGKRGLIYLGKGYVTMGRYTSLSNKIFLDVVRTHVMLLSGKRGSGKSYTIGVIAEELSDLPKEVSKNIAPIIFDTMGIYWTMKYKNRKDKELLEDWNLQSKELPVKVFVPEGHYQSHIDEGIPVDEGFALDVSGMEAEDWILTFGLDLINPTGVLIEKSVQKLKEKGGRFYIDDILKEIERDERSEQKTKNAAISLFEGAQSWGIFAEKGKEPTRIEDLATGGKTTVLDLSVYRSIGAFNVRGLVISIVSRKLFEQRMEARKKEEINSIVQRFDVTSGQEEKEMPLIWMFIDEAHEFLPLDEKTVATDSLVQLLREGRQPGISMVLATQQPGKIHRDVMTQSDIVLSHRVTSEQDLKALGYIMQSYMTEGINDYMNNLPDEKGSAIILDDNSERIYPMRIHPRVSWHGGEAPIAIKRDDEL
ncbi:MAG: ATP-binding protein [Candidatus Pacearchaeota archaeon]